jgi:hypothetical protein
MAKDYNRQGIQVKGDGNVIGNNNVLNSRREEHHHHHYESSSKGGRSGDDAAGVGFGILAAVLTISWLFVQYSAEVYFYIKLGAFVSAIPFFGIFALGIFWNSIDNKQLTAAVFGLVIAGATVLLAQYGQDGLDPGVVQFSQQAKGAWVFWQGLTEYGRNIVVGNLTGAICLGATAFFSLLMGVFVLWHFLADADIEDSLVLRVLNPFRPSRGGIFAILLLVVAWAFESGFAFQLLKPAAIQ